jgi:hypothetical protein
MFLRPAIGWSHFYDHLYMSGEPDVRLFLTEWSVACPLLIPFRPLMIFLAEMTGDPYNPLTTSSISSHTLIMISMIHEQRDLSKLPSTHYDHANHL